MANLISKKLAQIKKKVYKKDIMFFEKYCKISREIMRRKRT
jgi:hypothetical protein